jgi:hypothetical protein
VTFGPELLYGEGRTCGGWEAVALEVPPVDIADPMLSDLALGPHPGPASTGDHRLNQGLAVLCDGSEVALLLAVDRRVIVVPSPDGAVYAILEKPLSTDEVRRLQQQLRTMKFHLDEPTGELNEASRKAISAYALYRGAAYRFLPAAITENLLDGLGVLDTKPK